TPEERARWLLAQLLGWHRREDKAEWWEFFRLMDLTADELIDESHPLGGLELVGPSGPPSKGKQIWRYRFPAQDYDLGGRELYDPALKATMPTEKPSAWKTAELVVIDEANRTIDLRRATGSPLPHPAAVVALDVYQTTGQRAALERLGEWVAEHGIDADGPYRAIRDVLLGRPPRTKAVPGESLRRSGESDLEAAIRVALELDRTILPIQGPPGSGKTYSGARMICRLLAEGKRVGITANSHKVIGNLLRAVYEAAGTDVVVNAVQRGDEDQVLDDRRVVRGKNPAHVRAQLDGRLANLAAGTPWLWVSEAMRTSVDVLFVDEAGQLSLANVVAMAAAADSYVLLGDPQQLNQPLRGAHPPGAERSALAHVLDGLATIPPDRGLFLETTWRLHPDLCAFTSEAFYDRRLEPEPHLASQRLRTDAPLLDGVGQRLLQVSTAGDDNESPIEADAVASLALELVDGGATWVDGRGEIRPVTWAEVLIVAPYNAQVGAIRRLLPAEARVGTVDKFQGQEAPISIYSLTTSSPELAPRGMDFLYSRHRLNVATSRARCVALVAASPDLLRVRARTPEQMRLANAFCRFVEYAGGR
ncbi:MAG TPA: AAA domain-containing protein, partial [Candidatus Limnocylindrales bacterium]|nr:AAA domain-containing protein [Candidatus Limnocylindrales bacterium]